MYELIRVGILADKNYLGELAFFDATLLPKIALYQMLPYGSILQWE